MSEVFVGIDLGTTTTLIARAYEGDGPLTTTVLEIEQNNYSGKKCFKTFLPSLAYFPSQGEPKLGEEAQSYGANEDAARLVRAVKRHMGRRLLLPVVNEAPYRVSALYLQKVLDEARYKLPPGDTIFTVTVPASFSSNQRADTLLALQLACERTGIPYPENARNIFISEPVAAMLAFINDDLTRQSEFRRLDYSRTNNLMVYDIGGGTLDLTLVYVEPRKQPVEGVSDLDIHIRAIGNYDAFGGEDFDRIVAQELHRRMMDRFPNLKNLTLSSQQRAAVRLQLMNMAKRIKEELSDLASDLENGENTDDLFSEQAEPIQWPYQETIRLPDREVYLEGFMTWEEYCKIVKPLINGGTHGLIPPLQEMLERQNLDQARLDGMLVVGGMARVPLVIEELKKYWGNDRVWVFGPPDHAVVTGAAIYSYLRQQKPGFVLDEPAADAYYVLLEEGFDKIMPARQQNHGDKKSYRLTNESDVLLLQIFAGEDAEENQGEIEKIEHTLIYQGGTAIPLRKKYPKDTPVWVQMSYENEGQQDHTKVPWVSIWIGNENSQPFRIRYSDMANWRS